MKWRDDGHIYGKKSGARKYVMRRQLRCGDQIETHCYNSELIAGNSTKYSTVSTEEIFCLCYDAFVIDSQSNNKKTKDIKGNNSLPSCWLYFDTAEGIKVPTTGGGNNTRERSTQG